MAAIRGTTATTLNRTTTAIRIVPTGDKLCDATIAASMTAINYRDYKYVKDCFFMNLKLKLQELKRKPRNIRLGIQTKC